MAFLLYFVFKLGGSSRECVRLDRDIRWADRNCNYRYNFICEGTSTGKYIRIENYALYSVEKILSIHIKVIK